MGTPLQKQKRLQIILAIIVGLTLPCYGLGFLFVSLNRRAVPTATPRVPTPSSTWVPRLTDTPELVIPTRYPTFTATLTGTPTPTGTNTLTPTLTSTATETFTATVSPTVTYTPSFTPSETPSPEPSE